MRYRSAHMKAMMALLLCIALSACGGPATLLPSTPATQIHATVPAATRTATSLPMATEPLPTPTPRPTDTATPQSSTATKTANPKILQTEQAFEKKATQVASFSIQCEDFDLYRTFLSPNGTWVATACGDKRNQTLEIANKTGKRWVLKLTDYLTGNYLVNGETGLGRLNPVHWTSDETYLYFTPRLGFSGGGTCFYYHSRVQGLYRIDVNSGLISAVLTTTARPAWYEIAFSPVGGKLAYYGDRLTILYLRTGETVELDTRGWAVGNLTWSPDGTELSFGTCQATEDYSVIQKSNIKIYSLQTKNV